jgi:predicted DNA-binding transcriptional regulator AlpA
VRVDLFKRTSFEVMRVPDEINKSPKSASKTYAVAPRLVSRADAAHYVGISATLFYGLVSQGLMPFPKAVGSRRLWDVLELDKAIDELAVADLPAHTPCSVDPYDDVHA